MKQKGQQLEAIWVHVKPPCQAPVAAAWTEPG